jgi:hypothetical protein
MQGVAWFHPIKIQASSYRGKIHDHDDILKLVDAINVASTRYEVNMTVK